jgi:ATP-dependent Clp protease ATP-binding subunit ClpA
MFERFTKLARATVAGANVESATLGDDHIGTEHLLLGMLRLDNGVGPRVLARAGVTLAAAHAQLEAMRGGRRSGGPALTPEDDDALRSIGIDVDEIRRHVEESFGPGALDAPVGRTGRKRLPWANHRPFTPAAKEVMEGSLREALSLGHNYIGTEHVLLAIVAGAGPAVEVLRRLGADPGAVRARVLEELGRAA